MRSVMDAYFTYIIIALAIATLGLLAWNMRTEMRLKKLFKGAKAADLEETIKNVVGGILELEQAKGEILKLLADHDTRIRSSVRGVEITRFNPFQEAGSNQSFAIALLSEQGDGLVLSSLYSRDRMSVFAKPIKKHSSEFELTGEEKEVIKKATRV
jgi:hypothetical protein